MKVQLLARLAFLVCLCSASVFAQNLGISYQNPDALTACGEDQTTVELQNGSASVLTDFKLKITLPGGVRYKIGSVSGATESNVSNLGAPVFLVADLAAGLTASVTLTLEANCDVVAAINSGQLFANDIRADWNGGSEQITTNAYPVETGLIVINSIAPISFSGQYGDIVTRQISFTNTRQGKIASLHISDQHAPGLDIEIPGWPGTTVSPVYFEADLPGAFFTAFGDGDEFLEFGETAILSEKVSIEDCGLPPFVNKSTIQIGWGCGNAVCQTDDVLAEISILGSTNNPSLSFFESYGEPLSFCADTPSEQVLTIVNNGLAPASNVFLNFFTADSSALGIDFQSFTIDGVATVPATGTTGALLDCDQNLHKNVSLVVPEVLPGDTVRVRFNAFFCAEACMINVPMILGNYFYNKTCPATAFASGGMQFAPDTASVGLRSRVNFDIGVCLENDQVYDFTYWVASSRLKNSTGFLTIKMDLPWGLFWENSCQTPMLDGQSPLAVDVQQTPDVRSEVRLTFQLPFTKDSVAGSFCLRNICQDKSKYEPDLPSVPKRGADFTVFPVELSCNPCVLKVRTQTIISTSPDPADDCGVSTCDEYRLVMNCGCDDQAHCNGNCVKGLLVANWETFRTNYGLRDDNNDRQADSNAEANHQAARWDRFIPGDTMRARLRGVVEVNQLDGFKFRLFHESVASDFGLNDGDAFRLRDGKVPFVNFDSLRFVKAIVHFKIQGNDFTCPLLAGDKSDQHYIEIAHPNIRPYQTYDQLISMFHEFTVDLGALASTGCVPNGTLLQPGDSVVFEADFNFSKNFVPLSTVDPPLCNFRTTACDYRKVYAWNFANCAIARSQWSGFREYFSPGVFAIRPCENSQTVQPFAYSLRLARENMFPNEVRPLTRFLSLQHSMPAQLNLLDLRLKYLKMQENVLLFNDQAWPHTIQNGLIDFDFAPFFSSPIDEGLAWEADMSFAPVCEFSDPDTAFTWAKLDYPPGFHDPESWQIEKANPLGYYANVPRLDVFPTNDVIESVSENVQIDIFLKNLAVTPAQNTWIRVWTDDGSLSDISVVQLPSGQALDEINGIFQVGNLGGFYDLPFQIRGRNTSCEPVKVFIEFGWDCTLVTSQSAETCGSGVAEVELRTENPELELVIQQEPGDIQLCEPSDYFEIEIYNADRGFAYDLLANVKLPQGLKIQPGSSQIAYPNGAAWQAVADPQELPGNVWQWPIAPLVPPIAANGLPGVQNSPQNSLLLRFRAYAECGFVANSQPIFGTEGQQACGASSNVLRKPGMPVNLEGIAPTYDVVASLGYATGNGATNCGDEQTLAVTLNLQGQPDAGDSIYILLPEGLSFVPGSYEPLQSAPATPPVISDGQLQWVLSPDLTGTAVVKFTFKVKYDAAAGCTDQAVVLQCREKTTAFCPATNQNCAVYVATGESILFFNAENPDLALRNFSPEISANGQITFTADLANIGDASAHNAVVQFFLDQNNNGAVDIPGDQLVQTLNHNGNIEPGSLASLSGTLALSTADLCKLIAYVPAAENCACSPRSFPLSGWKLGHTTIARCDVNSVSFGVDSLAGHTYAWTPSAGLNCPTCAHTSFEPGPQVLPGDALTFILEEKTANCTIEHRFDVQFAGELGIQTPDQSVCRGEKIELEATPGGSYQWQGPGIADPNAQTQTIQPTQTSVYHLTVTFADGCTGSDQITVTVLERDSVDMGEIRICQGQTADVFGQQIGVEGLYSRVFQKANGCDSTLYLRLKVLPTEGQSTLGLCQGSAVEVFDSLVTDEGSYCKTFLNALGCDSVHCITVTKALPPDLATPEPDTFLVGSNMALQAPGGFVRYEWSPATGLSCSDCQSPVLSLDTGYYEIGLKVWDSNGCSDTVTYRLYIFPPCDPQRLGIPNSFTPDGDGLNDLFRVPPFEGFEQVQSLEIYNRWGERIYLGSGPSASWDGRLNGKVAPIDAYIYIVVATCPTDGPKKRVGDVTLFR